MVSPSQSGRPLAPDAASTVAPVLVVCESLGIGEHLAAFCNPVSRSGIGDLSAYAAGAGRDVQVVVTTGGAPMEEAIWDFPNLGLISVVGVGYDGIDVERARMRGVSVTTGKGANADDVADMALGLLIAAVRRIGFGERMVRSGAWRSWVEMQPTPSITQLRCGVVGLGAIGEAVARRLGHGFGADLSWWGPRARPDAPWPRAQSLQALAAWSDVMLVCAPATESTRHMIDADILALLGPGGYLINISRGSLVDEDALLAALRAGGIAGAGLDVYAVEPHDGSRWRDLDNVVVTPHCAGGGERGLAEIRRMCVANVAAFLKGEPLLTPLFDARHHRRSPP